MYMLPNPQEALPIFKLELGKLKIKYWVLELILKKLLITCYSIGLMEEIKLKQMTLAKLYYRRIQ